MNTSVQVTRFIYNQLPESVEEELAKVKLPKGGVNLYMYKKRQATAILPLGTDPNLVVQIPNSPVRGMDFVRNKWTITVNGKLIQMGLVGGSKPDGSPLFLEACFTSGHLFLSENNQDHQQIYKWLHLHPEFKQCIIKDHGKTALFYEFNPEAEAKEQLAKIALMDKAIDWVKGLNEGNADFIAEKLGITGSITAKRVGLRKLAETDPTRVLDTVKYIETAVMEETLNYAFNLGILNVDHGTKSITFGDSNQKVMDFNLNATDQKQAFLEVMTTSKDPSIKRLFGQVKAAVDAHATDSTMLQDLSKKKVEQIEVKKKEGSAKLNAEAINDL